MNKKHITSLIVVILLIVIGIIYGINHKKPIQENNVVIADKTETTSVEKKIICLVGPEVEGDWCKLPTGQRLLLSMTGDAVYDNGNHYSFSRNNVDQGVRLYKTENFLCSDHSEATSCDGATKLLLTASGSKDFYNSILTQLKDTYLQTRKDTDPQ